MNLQHIQKIGLISDWGLDNPNVAFLIQEINTYFPNINVYSIFHNVEIGHPLSANYFVRKSLLNFSNNTLIFEFSNNKLGNSSKYVLVKIQNKYIVTYENNVSDYLNFQQAEFFQFNIPSEQKTTKNIIKLLEFLQAGEFTTIEPYKPLIKYPPMPTGIGFDLAILYIDRFDNIITNLTEEFAIKNIDQPWALRFNDKLVYYKNSNLFEVRENEMVCYFNSAKLLKIGLKNGKLASALGFKMGPEKYLWYKKISLIYVS